MNLSLSLPGGALAQTTAGNSPSRAYGIFAGFARKCWPNSRLGGVNRQATTSIDRQRRAEPNRCARFAVDIAAPLGILNHMVLDYSPRLDRVFHALAHPARRAIIRQLARLEVGGERNLSELAAPLRMTFPAATKHVRVLERAKLVRRRVAGRQHLCRLHAAPLEEATLWTEQFRRNWEARFEALDSLLEEMKSDEMKSAKQSRSRRR